MGHQLREQKLVLLFDLHLYTSSAYYIVLPEGASRQTSTDFAEWVAGCLQD